MRFIHCVILTLLCALLLADASADMPLTGLTVVSAENSFALEHDGKVLLRYVYEDENILRPYFADITVNGAQITRNNPPIEGVDPTDHGDYHPGIWEAYGDINGEDFWRNKARVRHVEFVDPPSVKDNELRFTARNRFDGEDGPICVEQCAWRAVVYEEVIYLIQDAVFTPVGDKAVFGDQEEMGTGIRLATPLTVKHGAGVLLNSAGAVNEAGVWGKQAAWCDYSALLDGLRAGATVMAHPGNFRPAWFHARDYGLLVANPFGNKAFTEGEASSVDVTETAPLRLRYGLALYNREGEDQRALAANHYETYLKLAGATAEPSAP